MLIGYEAKVLKIPVGKKPTGNFFTKLTPNLFGTPSFGYPIPPPECGKP